ncbi:hypothetical protein F2Q68_00010632 [Brassica cretica]|uniref:alpha-1,2-Mannosidase n=1 Tax=Brassica cretica TaxID=69181 RepID=A0A8S9KNK0_BRACR|nr:hypothetical protein F2Q68_00010632 [Brassica cretica]
MFQISSVFSFWVTRPSLDHNFWSKASSVRLRPRLVLAGDVDPAIRTHTAFFSVWKRYGFTPEGFNLATLSVQYGQKSYPLRPELIESTYWLYKATRDPRYLDAGRDFVASLQYGAKCPCGYCHITDVELHKQEDHMESFFLAETVKYLWLLFDLAVDSDNLVDNGPYKYIFSTEGHLLPLTPQISLAREHCSYFGGYCPRNATKFEQSNDDHQVPEIELGHHSNIYPYHESFPVTGLIKGLCPRLSHAQKYGLSYVLPEKTERGDVKRPKPVITSRSIVLVSDQTVEKRPQEEGFTSESEPIMSISGGGSSSDQTGQELTLLEQEDGEPCGNKDVQCYKCRGYGHFKRECPMAKRRRFKGFRWRKIGHSEMQKKERSFIRKDDNESEKDEVLNLVAFGAHKDEASTSSESDSESEEGKYDE